MSPEQVAANAAAASWELERGRPGGVGRASRRPRDDRRLGTAGPAPPQLAVRAGLHRRDRALAGARRPGVRRQAVPDPERVDGADAEDRRPGDRRPREPPPRCAAARRRHRGLPSAGRSGRAGAAPAARRRRARGRRRRARARPRRRPTQTFIKRVVAVGGDTIAVRDGHAIRNGRRAAEPFAAPCGGGDGCDFPRAITVPDGSVFLLGDNRGGSLDSRFWGPVPVSWVIGEARRRRTGRPSRTGGPLSRAARPPDRASTTSRSRSATSTRRSSSTGGCSSSSCAGAARAQAFIDIGDQFLAISEGRAQGPDDARHFGLVVDDKEAVRAAVEAAGLRLVGTATGSTSWTRGATASRSSATPTSSSSACPPVKRKLGIEGLDKTERARRRSPTAA